MVDPQIQHTEPSKIDAGFRQHNYLWFDDTGHQKLQRFFYLEVLFILHHSA